LSCEVNIPLSVMQERPLALGASLEHDFLSKREQNKDVGGTDG